MTLTMLMSSMPHNAVSLITIFSTEQKAALVAVVLIQF